MNHNAIISFACSLDCFDIKTTWFCREKNNISYMYKVIYSEIDAQYREVGILNFDPEIQKRLCTNFHCSQVQCLDGGVMKD